MAQGHDPVEIADDLWIEWVPVAGLREQDVNAQVMQPGEFTRLVANVKDRGMLESLPYCHQPNGEGVVSTISGHHRVRAARAAGLTHIPVIVDKRVMSRSEVVSKQIAHNQLHGSPDEAILRQMIAMIDNPDDLLATGLGEDYLPTVERDTTSMDVPHADFEWRMLVLTFLPRQFDDFQQVIDMIPAADMVGVATDDQFEQFAKAVYKYARMKSIKSVSTAVALLTDLALTEIAKMEETDTTDTDTVLMAAHP